MTQVRDVMGSITHDVKMAEGVLYRKSVTPVGVLYTQIQTARTE